MALAGYRDLATLKARLLPANMGEDSDYDADLTAIGLGVAAQFDRLTGRILRRTVGATLSLSADRDSVVLTAYPVESIDAVKVIDSTGETDVSSLVQSTIGPAGIVRFETEPGTERQTLYIEHTGGYWCQDGADDELPTDATAIPDDLVEAWILQCRAVCEAQDIFRQKGAGKDDKKTGAATVASLTLVPAVRQTLNLYLRQP